jgi:hypothetical protein
LIGSVPEFHPPEHSSELEPSSWRRIGKRDRGAWHLGR